MTIHNHEAHKTALYFLRLAAEWRAFEADALSEAKEIAESAFHFTEERYPHERIEALQDAIKWLEKAEWATDLARQYETAADDAMRDATAEPDQKQPA